MTIRVSPFKHLEIWRVPTDVLGEGLMNRLLLLMVLGIALAGCKEESGGSAENGASSSTALKINGSTTVNLPASEAAEILRQEQGMDIRVDTQGGSSGGISMLAEGLVHIGMISKPISDEDRTKYPDVDFHTTRIGEDAVALIVSKDVWDSGVRALSKQQARDIYEGRITNWKDVDGADQRIVFFNKEPGRGTWEVFAYWAYGSPKQAPAVNFLEVGGNEETRNKVASTLGALSQLSSSWADGQTVFALGVIDEAGNEIAPTPANIAADKYPMSRPLYLVTNGEPTGPAKVFIDFMLSDQGQELVRKHGYLGLAELQAD